MVIFPGTHPQLLRNDVMEDDENRESLINALALAYTEVNTWRIYMHPSVRQSR